MASKPVKSKPEFVGKYNCIENPLGYFYLKSSHDVVIGVLGYNSRCDVESGLHVRHEGDRHQVLQDDPQPLLQRSPTKYNPKNPSRRFGGKI